MQTSRQHRAHAPPHQPAETIFPRETMSADPLKVIGKQSKVKTRRTNDQQQQMV